MKVDREYAVLRKNGLVIAVSDANQNYKDSFKSADLGNYIPQDHIYTSQDVYDLTSLIINGEELTILRRENIYRPSLNNEVTVSQRTYHSTVPIKDLAIMVPYLDDVFANFK